MTSYAFSSSAGLDGDLNVVSIDIDSTYLWDTMLANIGNNSAAVRNGLDELVRAPQRLATHIKF